MTTKQEILQGIRERILSLEKQIKKARGKNRVDLKKRLAIQKEAYEFNVWLSWRKLMTDPRVL